MRVFVGMTDGPARLLHQYLQLNMGEKALAYAVGLSARAQLGGSG
jgi:hypothetical protein